jgi:hypothetical protein
MKPISSPYRVFTHGHAGILCPLPSLLPTPLGRPYALTRARNAVDTRMLARPGRTPWDLEMLPTGPLVSMILDSILVLGVASAPRRAIDVLACSW